MKSIHFMFVAILLAGTAQAGEELQDLEGATVTLTQDIVLDMEIDRDDDRFPVFYANLRGYWCKDSQLKQYPCSKPRGLECEIRIYSDLPDQVATAGTSAVITNVTEYAGRNMGGRKFSAVLFDLDNGDSDIKIDQIKCARQRTKRPLSSTQVQSRLGLVLKVVK